MPTLEGKLVLLHGRTSVHCKRGACLAMHSAEVRNSATAIDFERGTESTKEGRQERDDEGCVFDAACGTECFVSVHDDQRRARAARARVRPSASPRDVGKSQAQGEGQRQGQGQGRVLSESSIGALMPHDACDCSATPDAMCRRTNIGRKCVSKNTA